jgi:membrane-bound lytic murein transglycosylase MltF
MAERRYIRALVSPSRTGYFVDRGAPHGIAYEMLQAFEDDLNRRLKTGTMKVRVLYVPVSREQLITGLVEGRGDVAVAPLTVTPQHRAVVDFSEPFVEAVHQVVVTGAPAPAIAGIDDLAGREVFIRKSSSYWEHLEQLNRRLEAEGKTPVRLRAAPEELDDEDILEMVSAGLVHVTVVDDYVAKLWAQVLPTITVHPAASVYHDGVLAWAFRKESPRFAAAANAFVATRRKGTAFGNTVLRRYAGNTTFVASASVASERAKFESLVDIFRRYSGQYDMDFLLMMAQGYQESRLDQRVVSRTGAIGVMQVMPAAGREMAVGDIRTLEPNVHAGVKYVHTMMNTYFPDDPKDQLNRTLFAFAAYNAGPSRIKQLRQEAEHRGLDRNVWFDNVEVVAADVIGSETVNYVGNIFKYSVAFRLLAEPREAREAATKSLN